MIVKGNSYNLAPGVSTSFNASGGTAPYTYAVAPGGIGGTINPTTGLYKAPYGTFNGFDTIIATDDAAETAEARVNILPPLGLLCQILKQELGLDADQVVMWDQKFNIPTDSRMYVTVGVVSSRIFASSITYEPTEDGLQSIQTLNQKATIDINIMSRGPVALDRKEEVILALGSTYCEQQQEQNSFYIAKLPTNFVNLSQVDGAAIPYRFVITINMQYLFNKLKSVEYFDTFEGFEIETQS